MVRWIEPREELKFNIEEYNFGYIWIHKEDGGKEGQHQEEGKAKEEEAFEDDVEYL